MPGSVSVDANSRVSLRGALKGLLDDGASGALRQRRLDEKMAVAVETAECNESLVRREAPAVD